MTYPIERLEYSTDDGSKFKKVAIKVGAVALFALVSASPLLDKHFPLNEPATVQISTSNIDPSVPSLEDD
jgi:hypothetical protein